MFVFAGAGALRQQGSTSVPQERSHWKSKTEHRSAEFLEAAWAKKGAMIVKSPSWSWELGSQFKAMLKRHQLLQKKGAWALKLFTLGECRGQREALGNREEQVLGVNREKRKAREKKPATAAPQRSSVMGWRKTALSPVLSKEGCCCLQHPMLSDHPFNSPH